MQGVTDLHVCEFANLIDRYGFAAWSPHINCHKDWGPENVCAEPSAHLGVPDAWSLNLWAQSPGA